MHKYARKNFKRRRVIVKGLNDLFQIDLVDGQKFAKFNNGYKFLLTCIDCFSKYAFVKCLKSKKTIEVSQAMEEILKEQVPANIQADQGGEFVSNTFKKLMEKYNINFYWTYSGMKAQICERFNRSLRELMFKEFSRRGSYRYVDFLDQIVQYYNNRWHRTIKRGLQQ